jgi:hypothetical protein
MDHLISSLDEASTSSQLKCAADALPRHEKHYTEQVRDLIIAKKDLIVDAETADSVVKFLFSFSQDWSRRSLLQTKEVQDFIINIIAPRVTAIEEFGRTICDFIRDEKSAELFSNVESFTAILQCFHRSKTSADAIMIASSINNIIRSNPSSKTILCSLPVVEAFSFIIPLASNAEAVEWISEALMKLLNNNEEAKQKFGTPEFLKICKGMEKHATTDGSKTSFRSVLEFIDPTDYLKPLVDAATSSQLKSAVDVLPHHEKYYTEVVRDLIIAKKDLIVDAETADSVASFFFSFSRHYFLRSLLHTKEIHDLIINHIAAHVTVIEEFGELIYTITYNDKPAAELFSNVESFCAILKCFRRSKTSKDALWIALSINNILNINLSSNKLLNSLPVVEAFSFIIPLVDDAHTVYWISEALLKILENNEEAQQKFATPEFLGVFQGMKKHATIISSNRRFQTVLELLMKK